MKMQTDYLHLLPQADQEAISALQQQNSRRLTSEKRGIKRLRELAQSVSHLRARHLDFSGPEVVIGHPDEIDQEERKNLEQTLRSFMPWRKGPFSIFGIDIDAEWRSNRKWERLRPHLPDLTGKVVADIGCNNGYYMFRLAQHKPKLVLGFEPYLHHFFTFQALNSMAGQDNLSLELLGVEEAGLFTKSFDLVLLLGILYHRVSPLDCLREVRKAMTKGATLIVESQAIPGEREVALFPESRYAKVPGTYFVPTASCLANWIKRAGFSEVEIFASHPMSSKEQRRTEWMEFESYSDFLDPANPSLTIEGYPAPWRVFVKAINAP
ncbi:MAG: tRNA 5-methoxyuridine(34)/uridine 5-oxyacetic acid(34) synthase CmoB [Thermodesulfobacteriota bacterium]